MAMAIDENGKRIKLNSTMRLIRDNYRDKNVTLLTYAEVADMCGLSVTTVCGWVYKGLLPLACRVGPYRIDKMSAQKFLRTGEKQCGWNGKEK